jgi:polyisoprenoid-binding protein YceI
MKLVLILSLISFSLFANPLKKAATATAEAKNQVVAATTVKANVDTTKSTLKWTGSKWAGTKLDGSHWGYVKIKNGVLSFDGKNLAAGEFVIDMTSIDAKDTDGTDGDAKLEGHLKNADFFDVTNKEKNGGEAKLVIKSVKPTGEAKAEITADLTILNVTKPLTFAAEVTPMRDGTFKASSKFKINRVDYGIKYKSKSILDKAADNFIHDEMEFEIALNTVK